MNWWFVFYACLTLFGLQGLVYHAPRRPDPPPEIRPPPPRIIAVGERIEPRP